MLFDPKDPAVEASRQRRRLLLGAAAGTAVVVLGSRAVIVEDDPRAKELRPDGRPRLPPGQRLLHTIKPMGGTPGDPNPAAFRLRVYGEVENPFELRYDELLAMPQVEQACDVHCVTGWSVLDSRWVGVPLRALAERARVMGSARHVIFEAAHGYTANVRLDEALAPHVLIAHSYEGSPLTRPHGPPVRALVPELYFWKSAKWLTGVRFRPDDRPGYWEIRGYHNHADPWLEERYS
jgi:DMSO/TMAO reductase YedYZ molybdopterin-dependent catalytic subunit